MVVQSPAFSSEAEIEDLREQVKALRKELNEKEAQPSARAEIDNRLCNVLGAPVATKQGRLEIGGLLQVWGYAIQRDGQGVLNVPAAIPGGVGALDNRTASNSSFRVRRAELRLKDEITPNVRAVVSIDPAREATAFPSLPSNQGTGISGDSDVSFFSTCDCAGESDPRALGAGGGLANRMLQDAYIEYHDYVPHHDFRVGQMIRRLGEEGSRDNGDLDFAERAMITQPAELRDLGVQAHGSWFCGRLQYWLGVFDGAGTAFQQRQNRADDNNDKDVAFTILGRQLWDNDLGHFEVGYSILNGKGGETHVIDPIGTPLNGLDRRLTTHQLEYAWASYAFPGVMRGWWVRGEWGDYRDRFAPGEVVTGESVATLMPRPFSAQGWYVSTGYKLADSVFADRLACSSLRKLEFLFRYEVMQNIFFHDLVDLENRLDVFKTRVYTAGVNYFVSGNNVKLQLNYNWVGEPGSSHNADDRQLRSVKNDNVVLNLQVEF